MKTLPLASNLSDFPRFWERFIFMICMISLMLRVTKNPLKHNVETALCNNIKESYSMHFDITLSVQLERHY